MLPEMIQGSLLMASWDFTDNMPLSTFFTLLTSAPTFSGITIEYDRALGRSRQMVFRRRQNDLSAQTYYGIVHAGIPLDAIMIIASTLSLRYQYEELVGVGRYGTSKEEREERQRSELVLIRTMAVNERRSARFGGFGRQGEGSGLTLAAGRDQGREPPRRRSRSLERREERGRD